MRRIVLAAVISLLFGSNAKAVIITLDVTANEFASNPSFWSQSFGFASYTASGELYSVTSLNFEVAAAGPLPNGLYEVRIYGLFTTHLAEADGGSYGRDRYHDFTHSSPNTRGLGVSYSINYTPDIAVSTPEPSTWVMMLIGFAGIALTARRRSAHWFERQQPRFQNTCQLQKYIRPCKRC